MTINYKKIPAIKDKPYENDASRLLALAPTHRTSPITAIIYSKFINPEPKPTILPFYRSLLNSPIGRLYEVAYLLSKINNSYPIYIRNTKKTPTIEDESDDDVSTVSTSTTPTTSSPSPNTHYDLNSPEQVIDSIYSEVTQLTEQFDEIYNSLTNQIEKLITVGDLLCKINDCYVTNANSGITDLDTSLEYIWNTYYSYLPLYRELLIELFARAQNTQDFHTFNAIVDKIPDSILEQNEDIINSFGYGPQIQLLQVHITFSSLSTDSKSHKTTDYQNQLYDAYELDPSDINYACFLLVRSNLLNRYLQKYKNFDNQCNDSLIKDFVFIAKAMLHIFNTVQDNPDLQSKLELYKFWNDFAALAINLLKSYGFQESELLFIYDLNSENIQSLLGLLNMFDPKYFLEIKPIKREIIFSDDIVGDAMHNNYYTRPGKTKISLQYIDLETTASIISYFESYLKNAIPFNIKLNIPSKIWFKIKLLQRRYVEESFGQFSDVNNLLNYYIKYAQIVEETTNGVRIPAAMSEYCFQMAELLAHRYYAITGTSIPPLEHLIDYNTITQSHPSYRNL